MRMRTYLMLALAMIVGCGTVLAQDEVPRVELFGGLSYLRTSGNSNVNGINGQANININRWVGIAADLAGHFQTSADADLTRRTGARPSANAYSFLFGPQFSERAGRMRGFAHFLVGAARLQQGFKAGGGGVPADSTVLSWAAGGGVDLKVTDMIDVRAITVDYQYIKSPDIPLVPVGAMKGGRNNIRVGIGLVFKLK